MTGIVLQFPRSRDPVKNIIEEAKELAYQLVRVSGTGVAQKCDMGLSDCERSSHKEYSLAVAILAADILLDAHQKMQNIVILRQRALRGADYQKGNPPTPAA